MADERPKFPAHIDGKSVEQILLVPVGGASDDPQPNAALKPAAFFVPNEDGTVGRIDIEASFGDAFARISDLESRVTALEAAGE